MKLRISSHSMQAFSTPSFSFSPFSKELDSLVTQEQFLQGVQSVKSEPYFFKHLEQG
jgi:hypothetical protein